MGKRPNIFANGHQQRENKLKSLQYNKSTYPYKTTTKIQFNPHNPNQLKTKKPLQLKI